jgi:hypothetical protein
MVGFKVFTKLLEPLSLDPASLHMENVPVCYLQSLIAGRAAILR